MVGMDKAHSNETRMTLGEHLEELRRRILFALVGLAAGMVVALCFGREILEALKYPYVQVMTDLNLQPQLRVLSATAGFTIYLKVSLIGGLLLSSPWVFYQLWRFVSAGLYTKERNYVLMAVPVSAGLFVGGARFYLFIVAVPIMHFFIGFNNYLGLQNDLTLKNHISMMTNMMLVFGLAFQLPIVVALLGIMGLVTPQSLGRYRRYVIVVLFIIAALVTSPSPLDQILLAVPMWVLFELGVLTVWLIHRKRNAAEKEIQS